MASWCQAVTSQLTLQRDFGTPVPLNEKLTGTQLLPGETAS